MDSKRKLTDIVKQFKNQILKIPVPVYGNWCGPNYGSGRPVDALDALCREHDNSYAAGSKIAADKKFVRNLHRMGGALPSLMATVFDKIILPLREQGLLDAGEDAMSYHEAPPQKLVNPSTYISTNSWYVKGPVSSFVLTAGVPYYFTINGRRYQTDLVGTSAVYGVPTSSAVQGGPFIPLEGAENFRLQLPSGLSHIYEFTWDVNHANVGGASQVDFFVGVKWITSDLNAATLVLADLEPDNTVTSVADGTTAWQWRMRQGPLVASEAERIQIKRKFTIAMPINYNFGMRFAPVFSILSNGVDVTMSSVSFGVNIEGIAPTKPSF